RHVSSGSSFGANPLRQTIGLGEARRVALLQIDWPTSGTTQVFRDIAADQAIEITELVDAYRPLVLTQPTDLERFTVGLRTRPGPDSAYEAGELDFPRPRRGRGWPKAG